MLRRTASAPSMRHADGSSRAPSAAHDSANRLQRVTGPFGDRSYTVQLPQSALAPPKQRPHADGRVPHDTTGRDGQFAFWGGRRERSPYLASGSARPPALPGEPAPAPSAAAAAWRDGSTDRRRPNSAPRSRPQSGHDTRMLVVARPRGRSPPPRWGPAAERRLSIANRPHWRSLAGFPETTTALSEYRKMDPFSDINSYAARKGLLPGGVRQLDCKGMLGARPVQQWKEMLRNT